MTDPVLDQIYEYCKYSAPVEGDERDLCYDGVLCVLLYRGLIEQLPEIVSWKDLDTQTMRLKRVDLVNNLVEYAQSKDLDESVSFNCAGLIAKNINHENLYQIVQELEKLAKNRQETRQKETTSS